MSKMSQLHAELSEQAYKLGFESIGEAEQAGYGVDWENGKMIKVEDEQEKAHEAWLKEREDISKRINELYDELVCIGIGEEFLAIINDVIEFIKKGEV